VGEGKVGAKIGKLKSLTGIAEENKHRFKVIF